MNQAYVTLEEVLTAASARAASLVSETAGYLVLALGDATAHAPCAIDERAVTLSTEGHVAITRRGPARTSEQGAEQLRSILARLLAVGTSTAMPSLTAAARPRGTADRGVEAVVHEIEAALIPVNRAAAQRALARLARETLRARESGRLSRATLPPPVPARVLVVRASVARHVEIPGPLADARGSAIAPAPVEETATPIDAVESALSASATPSSPVMSKDELSDGSSSAVTTIPSHVVSATVFRGDDLPLIRTITPLPPGTFACSPLDRASCDHTPTLLGVVAPVAAGHADLAHPAELPSPIPEEVETGLKTVVEARVDFATPLPDSATSDALRTPTPSGLAAVMAHPTEDAGTAFELDLASRALQAAPAAALEPRGARDANEPEACLAPLPEAKPTRADDLIARFGMSCVDDASLAATRLSLRKMAGLDLTPPPRSAPVRASSDAAAKSQDLAPVSAGVSREAQATEDLEAESIRERPPARAARRSRVGAVMAWAIVLCLGLAAIYRFVPEASGIVMLARDMLRPVPAPTSVTPPKAPASVEAPVPATTATPIIERVDRGTTRAERGTAQRQR